MQPDKLTQKSREALADAQQLAAQLGQQAIELPHLMLALLRQQGGVVLPLLEKIGVRQEALEGSLKAAAARLPKVAGGEPYMGSTLNQALLEAQKHADQMQDSYVSTEHLLLAVAASSKCSVET
ncbi:MAG: hypothetical protein EOO40_09825 [Deltaproteobacteria bacterium]|nr:MAG: hypothetical protein EOO40_09825 [Deltaproteobacteria bacterium]